MHTILYIKTGEQILTLATVSISIKGMPENAETKALCAQVKGKDIFNERNKTINDIKLSSNYSEQ